MVGDTVHVLEHQCLSEMIIHLKNRGHDIRNTEDDFTFPLH